LRKVLRPLLAFIVLIFLWEGAVRGGLVQRFLLPRPTDVLAVLLEDASSFIPHAAYTLTTTLIGFGLAVLLGVLLAMLIVQFRIVEDTVYPLLVSFNSLPKVAVAPLFIVWLGTGMEPKVAIAAMIAIFAVVIDTVHGLRSVPPDLLDLGRSLRGSRLQLLWRIRLPHALPSMFAGMKVAVSLALIGSIVGEFVAAKKGLGYLVLVSQGQMDVVRMFAALAVLSVLGLLLFYGVAWLERLCVPWQAPRKERAGPARKTAARPSASPVPAPIQPV
jgi:NitT/TauT family transport system permease protein